MALLTDRQREELTRLQGLVRAVSGFLTWLTIESGAVPEDLAGEFGTVLTNVAQRLQRVVDQLGAIEDTDESIWQKLDDAGLTGDALRLKLRIWERLANPLTTSEPPIRRRGALRLGRVMDFVNSLLGSLATVFPPVELAREYKDGVEAVLDESRTLDPPTGRFSAH